MAKTKKKIRRKGQVFRVLDKLVSKEPYTAEDLSHELEIAYQTAKRYLRELWMMDIIHINAWDRKYNHSSPVYKWGPGEDKEKPKAYTRYDISRRYRERNKDKINARRRERARTRRVSAVSV